MSEFGNFLGMDAVMAKRKVHMGVWKHDSSTYATKCSELRAGNKFIVRREDEWKHVDCKRCLKYQPQDSMRKGPK